MKNIENYLGAVYMRSWNMFQYNAKIHTNIICALAITVHMMRSCLNLESIWFQSGLPHRFEISIWFENLELMTMLLSDCGSTTCALCFWCKTVVKYFIWTKNISNGIEISNRFDFSSSFMQTASKFIFFAAFVLCALIYTVLPFLDKSNFDGMNKDIKEEYIQIIDGKRCFSVISCCMTVW